MALTYEPINTVTTTGSQATVSFSSIPQTYTDLVLCGSTRRGVNGAGDAGWSVTFNGDTGANYSQVMMYAGGSNAFANRNNTFQTGAVGDGVFCANEMHIMNYSQSNTAKILITRMMVYGSSSPATDSRMSENLWRGSGNAAITSITLSPVSGFWDGSVITLYGIKAA